METLRSARSVRVAKPAWRGWLHAAGFAVSVPAGATLVAAAPARARAAVGLYAVCVALLFLTSASYHRFARSTRWRLRLRRADHAMIFLVIAATYTPLCLLGMPRSWGVPLLGVVWAACLVGAGWKLVSFEGSHDVCRVMYAACAVAWLVALPVLAGSVPGVVLALLAAGVGLVGGGSVVLLRNSPNPAPATFGYHELFHACSLGAVACHYAMVAVLAGGATLL